MSAPTPPNDDIDYELLKQIDGQQNTSQRALAQNMGVSIGKVNYCIKAVIGKGWVKVNNFRRADNKWAYTYLLTPSGVSAKMRLARDFLVRKEQEFERLQREIDALRQEVSRSDANSKPDQEGARIRDAHRHHQ